MAECCRAPPGGRDLTLTQTFQTLWRALGGADWAPVCHCSLVGMGKRSFMQSTQREEAPFFLQITDSTLIQLSIHCPRLQVLVSSDTLSVFFL